jgi:hypothetical protein
MMSEKEDLSPSGEVGELWKNGLCPFVIDGDQKVVKNQGYGTCVSEYRSSEAKPEA